MNYTECLQYIEKAKTYGSVLGLESIKQLLKQLGNPQENLKFVHIAGTNGKGSISAFIASILGVSGYKVGRYISPSVISYEEKIQITTRAHQDIYDTSNVVFDENTKTNRSNCSNNDVKISTSFITKEELGIYLTLVKVAVDKMTSNGYPHPTLFEIETALSFLYFYEKKCDVVVLEVGLGGRLDATNIVETVLCSVITSISMDHMEFLGDTLDKIAYEKAGIIKPGVPVVSYEQADIVSAVLKEVASKNSSTYKEVNNQFIDVIATEVEGSTYNYKNYTKCEIHLVGTHQIMNSVLAILAIEELVKQGYGISYDDITCGLKETRWKGRFEVVEREPYFVIDGAHNEDAALVLAKNIRTYFKGRRIIYIMGVLKDKDYKQLIKHTAELATDIITITPNNSRGLSGDILAEELVGYCNHIHRAKDVEEAVNLAHRIASKEDVIIAFGSLSYLYEIYRLMDN